MEASFSADSPRRRISMKQKSLVAMDMEEDEEQDDEVKNRRLQAIHKSTTQQRRSVAALLSVSMNPSQLAKHCKDCLKLSAENKINSKNCFSFLIIDFMAEMAKKSDSEISQNFQVATSTLDASVKIYGYRVDAVHTDAMKMVGGLLSKELQALDDNDDEGGEDGDDGKTAKVKKRKRKYTVVAASTLNGRTESEVLLDVPPKKTMLARGGEGTRLLTCVPKYNDGCLFMVEADTPCWPSQNQQMPKFAIPDDFDVQTVVDMFSKIPINPGDKLCETVSEITFGADYEEEPDFEPCDMSAFEFDVDASVQDPDCDDPTAPPPRLAIPFEGYGSDDDIALPEQAAKTKVPSSIIELTNRLSTQDQEYSLFDNKILKSWAGPMYGNWRPTRVYKNEDKENTEEGCLKAAAKRGRRTKPVESIMTWFDTPEDEVTKNLKPSSSGLLAKSTLCAWKKATVTLTTDYRYTPAQFSSLFHLPLHVEHLRKESSGGDLQENDIDEPVGNELALLDSSDAVEEPADTSAHDVEEWDADNMVAVPVKVEKIFVGKFQAPKHVDMKQLKTCIWDIISDSGDEKHEKNIQFVDLCKACPAKLPKKVADIVSVPVLFNALLHLANEKSLVLTQKENDTGFVISV